jgi:uncharacterized damage-inducible protein DinB
MDSNTKTATLFLNISINDLKRIKDQIAKALEQLSWEDYHYAPDPDSNSIAILMKHIAGNMISRWTDFLTSDGEKHDRKRDTEFIDEYENFEELKKFWEKGWECLFKTLAELAPEDILRTVFIRGEAHTVLKAIIRAHNHYSFHAGQIIFLAKQIKKGDWKTLSIPKGKSEEFNKEKFRNK